MNLDRAFQNRRAFALATEVGLTDDERRELAFMLPSQSAASGPVSWASVSDADLRLLGDWLHGAVLCARLAALRAIR